MASGNTLAHFEPQANQPPSSNFAGLDTNNGHMVLDFAHGSTTSAIFAGVMPRNYAAGGVTVTFFWLAQSGNSGNVRWGAAFERDHSGDDVTADHWSSNQLATTAAPGTAGQLTSTTLTFTDGAQMSSVGAGDPFRIRLQRIGGDAADTMTPNAQLVGMEIKET